MANRGCASTSGAFELSSAASESPGVVRIHRASRCMHMCGSLRRTSIARGRQRGLQLLDYLWGITEIIIMRTNHQVVLEVRAG